jgi:hypothetical protein
MAEMFRIRPDRLWGPPSLLYNEDLVIPGGKAVVEWLNHPPTSSEEVKGKSELNFYSPSVPS